MRWYEIIHESDDIIDQTRDNILDMITPLLSQGIATITVQQVISQLSQSSDLKGINITDDLIMQALDGVKGITIEPDTANGGKMTIKLSPNDPTTDAAQQQSDKGADKVDQAATRQAKQDIGM